MGDHTQPPTTFLFAAKFASWSYCNCLQRKLPVVLIQSCLDTTSFSRVVNSFRIWLKERRILIHPNGFLVQAKTLLEVIEICVQFHCLSSYPNDLYRNERLQDGNSLQRNLKTDDELAPKIHGREDWDISIADFIEKPFVLNSYKRYSLREEQVGSYTK